MTAVGRVRLTRQYVTTDRGGQFPADAVLGVDGYVTAGAQRMAVLAGTRDSFARAEVLLRELTSCPHTRNRTRAALSFSITSACG